MHELIKPTLEQLLESFPEQLAEIFEFVQMAAQEKGCSEPKAKEIAFESCNKIRVAFGGTAVYFGKADAIELIDRDFEIFAKFRQHGNYDSLAIEYRVTTQQIRNIIRTIGSWQLAQRQKPLFEDNPKAVLSRKRGRRPDHVRFAISRK